MMAREMLHWGGIPREKADRGEEEGRRRERKECQERPFTAQRPTKASGPVAS